MENTKVSLMKSQTENSPCVAGRLVSLIGPSPPVHNSGLVDWRLAGQLTWKQQPGFAILMLMCTRLETIESCRVSIAPSILCIFIPLNDFFAL